jgi:hypothetical protein
MQSTDCERFTGGGTAYVTNLYGKTARPPAIMRGAPVIDTKALMCYFLTG